MLVCFMVSGLSALGFRPTRPSPASLFANWLPLHSPTPIPIPFLFNHSWSLRIRRRPTARLSSLSFSLPCGHSPLQQGGTPPSSLFFTQLAPSFEGSVLREGLPRALSAKGLLVSRHLLQSPLFPAIHPFSLQPLTKCSSSNSFVLTTIHFHGGGTPSTRKS